MPDPTKPGDGQPGAGAGAPEGGEPPKSGPPPKMFTQEELDAIIETRLRRAIPADYESLKAMKAEKDTKDEADKTELQKAKDAAALAEANAKKVSASANTRLRKAAILEAATAAGAVDADTVAALLAGSADITVDDEGTVKGVKAAVTALLKEKPFLAKAMTPGAAGGHFGGNDPKDKVARIAELERAAQDPALTPRQRQQKSAEARVLKLTV